MKALLYSLTLLLFSLGAHASEQRRDEALPASHVDISIPAAVVDPTPVSGADRLPAAIAIPPLFDLAGAVPAHCCMPAKALSITGLYIIRAPPRSSLSL
ncbi:hypothetical protein [Marinobacterium rhizophilum]|uniref:Uncharacterized protein n=1 Tax=Marinobacterium rhizophilum TaxID=420402 RepID=A0ABY5HHQ3_9GAMM|nr:hypothetical protein [Marinobacterium rhizophilum]UTW11892.1 hypothetical protein KDW95_22060 [Marinobacterium rhizophilum]